MAPPHIQIDLDKIEHNAAAIVRLCQQHGMEVTGVTKGTCGHPEVARAMLRGGVMAIGESRMENLRRLQTAGITAPFWLLRLPPLSEAETVVATVEISLNSELAVLAALSAAACRRQRPHGVVLMVDLGDLREGLWPDELMPFVSRAVTLRGIRIAGVGTNLTCFGGVVPSIDNMSRLVELAEAVENRFGLHLRWVSGANSSGLELIASGTLPKRINHARIGEAILLGRETLHRRPWPGTYQDAFLLYAEVLEVKDKPSLPVGERTEDAFGHRPRFADRGQVRRAILNVGREDVDIEGLHPLNPRFRIIGGSSDYLILDVTGTPIRVGDRIPFALNYAALLAAMTSAYVEKRAERGGRAIGEGAA